jgi:hypothetical protein
MKTHRFQYLLAGFSLQAFLALALAISIASGGSFFLGYTNARLIVLALLLLLGIVPLVLAIYFHRKQQLDQIVDQFIELRLADRSIFSVIFISFILVTVCSVLPLIPLLPFIGKVIAVHSWEQNQISRFIAKFTCFSPLLLIIALLSLESTAFLSFHYKNNLLSSWKKLLSNIKLGINRLDTWAQNHLKSVLSAGPLALIITGIFFLFLLLKFKIGYGSTDDDLQIVSLLGGYNGNTPTPFSIYPSFGLAFPLMLLYRLHTSLNWFMVFLAVLIFVSTWGLLYSFIGLKNSKKAIRLISVILVLACTSDLLMRLTFTSAAGYAIVAGLFLFLFSLVTDENPKPLLLGTAVALIVLGSLTRPETLFIPLIIFFPWLITNADRPHAHIYFATFGITLILLLAGSILNNEEYDSTPAWNNFITYSNVRSDIQDTARIDRILQEKNSSKLTQIRWSINDGKMFKIWFFTDLKIYSYQNLQFLDNNFSPHRQFPQETWNDFIAFIGDIDTLPYIALLLSTFLLLLSSPPQKIHFILTIFSCFCAMGILIYLGWSMKLADRVTFPPIAALALLNLFFWNIDRQTTAVKYPKWGKVVSILLTSISLVTIAYSTITIYKEDLFLSKINKQREDIYSSSVADIDKMISVGEIPKDTLFLGPNRGFPIEWSNPFLLTLPDFHYVIMDWITNSPTFEEFIQKYGIQSLVCALYQRDNVYLFASEKDVPIVQEYIREHDGIDVSEKIIYSPTTDSIFDYHNSHLYKFFTK